MKDFCFNFGYVPKIKIIVSSSNISEQVHNKILEEERINKCKKREMFC